MKAEDTILLLRVAFECEKGEGYTIPADTQRGCAYLVSLGYLKLHAVQPVGHRFVRFAVTKQGKALVSAIGHTVELAELFRTEGKV